MLDCRQRRPGFSRWSWSGGQTLPAASWRGTDSSAPSEALLPSAATQAGEQALLTQSLGTVHEAAPGAKDFVEKRVLKWRSEVVELSHRRWAGEELEFWPRGTEVLRPYGHKPVLRRCDWFDLWQDTPLPCQEETWKKKVPMEGFTVVWVYLSAVQSQCAGRIFLSPISRGATSLRTNILNMSSGWVWSFKMLPALKMGIKGQCHNLKHLSITGLLPWQFAYSRKCKQISQEAVWLGNLPEILQASVRLRTSIFYLGIRILNQCS